MNDLPTAHSVVLKFAAEHPDREFLLQPVDGRQEVKTFSEAADHALRIATALNELGLQAGDKVGILSKNCAEWLLAELAIAMAGMVSIPIYPTASAGTVAYILEHSEAKAVFVGKLENPDAIASAIPESLPSIAFPYPTVKCRFDWQELVAGTERLAQPVEPAPEDVMTILYTSGSTGKPKGVVISFRAYIYACTTVRDSLDLGLDDRVLSYLPLAHVTDRMALAGPAIYAGARIFFVDSLETFQDDLRTARPTLFGSVPRLWVKFQAGIHSKIPPGRLRFLLSLPVVGKLVSRRVREGMGLDQCKAFGSGSAPISPHTLEWYHRLGIDISEGWGMSETSGLSCVNHPFRARRIGTIGLPLEGTELTISSEGELLIRCPGLFTEYYKQPDLTKEVFTEDGFFRTGDKAEWDAAVDGFRITGRVKDIFKSAKGKYVVPVPIEARLGANPLLEQVCVIGSGLPAPIAIVVLAETARKMSKEAVEQSLVETLEDTNAGLESHERLSNMLIVNDEWTTENDLLTPTLKVKREQLDARYLPAVADGLSRVIAWEGDGR